MKQNIEGNPKEDSVLWDDELGTYVHNFGQYNFDKNDPSNSDLTPASID